MITTNQFKIGMTIDLEGSLFNILDFQHVKPGKGQAFVRTKLKNLKTGAVLDRTFRAGEKVELARLDHRKMQHLYSDGSHYVFMDSETYEQLSLDHEQLGDSVNYLKEGMLVEILMYEGKAIGVETPIFVELEVVSTPPGIKGDTATAGTKPATLETGVVVQVPLFVEVKDVIRVDTRTGEYITRMGGK
ncbi:MAG TPA: elongation factor P [Actinobacteria bacterium]|nr:elongation factor P [Actinomycetota bacterium]